jgi:hypothetical protein
MDDVLLQLIAMGDAPLLEVTHGRRKPGGQFDGGGRRRLGGRDGGWAGMGSVSCGCKMWRLGVPRRMRDRIGFANLRWLHLDHID